MQSDICAVGGQRLARVPVQRKMQRNQGPTLHRTIGVEINPVKVDEIDRK